MKEAPLFLIAHNKLAKTDGKFIVCTKSPSFLAKLIEFENAKELEDYEVESKKYFQKLPNRNAILELVKFLDTSPESLSKVEKIYKKMVIWFSNYGENNA